ncbi:MAG: pyridoxamine 5'-phosphate oxidase family protein [Micrococcales bacterium]|nr:pyridoxamine 5'-phosphate oxidase family protein [Micrococcales bacterium]
MTILQPSRHCERAVSDRTALDALLDRGRVAHVALNTEDGQPLVLPTAYARDGDRLIIHGAPASPWHTRAAAGAPVCVAVSEVSAVVVGRGAGAASLRYASAVLFGSFVVLPDEQKAAALRTLTDHLVPGGAARLVPPTPTDVAGTLVLALPIDRWSLKANDGWPHDAADPELTGWAGIVPLVTTWGEPVAAPGLQPPLNAPDEIRALAGRPA